MDYLDRINKVLVYIENNLFSPLSLDELASEANFSTYHFHRIFYSVLGETPVQYQRRRRMENSAKDLYKSDTAIKEISSNYGFSSPAVYSRDFKKHFGESPLALKNKLQSRIQTDNQKYRVELKTVSSFAFAYTKITGFHKIVPSFFKLKSVLRRSLVKNRKMVEFIYDNQYITPKEKCRYDIGAIVTNETSSSDLYSVKETDDKLYAVVNLRGNTKKIDECFDSIFSWIIGNEYEPDDSPLLIIFNKMFSIRPLLPMDYTNADICVPVKSKNCKAYSSI